MDSISNSVEGVILAAGLSLRAGVHKMMLEIDDSTVLGKCIENMYEACSGITVVGGYKIENILRVASAYSKVRVIYNTDYLQGMFSSVKCGFKNIEGERAFITPGDCPFIKKDTYLRLLTESEEIVIPAFQGKSGHPVLISRKMIEKVLKGQKYTRLKEFIELNGYKIIEVNDRGILMDIDTLEDYAAALKYYGAVGKWL